MHPWNDVGASFQPSLSMTLRGHHHGVRSVAFQSAPSASPAMPKLISGAMDGAVMVWDTAATARALRLMGHRGPVLSVSQSSRPNLFASGGQDGYVRVWAPDERRVTASYSTGHDGRATNSACEWRAHSGATRAVAFARDGTDRLYSVGDDKAVKSWDLATLTSTQHRAKRLTNKFAGGFAVSAAHGYAAAGHTHRVSALAVQSPATSGQFFHYVASGGDDGVVFVWDTRSREAAHVVYGCGGSVGSLSFHPDGFVLASGDAAGDVNLFDLRRSSAAAGHASYSLLQHYHAAHVDGRSAGTESVDFAPNGGWLLSSGNDGTAKLWDVKEGHLYCTVQAHEGPVASARFSDDGAWFATGGAVDKTVLVWRSGLAASCATSPSAAAAAAAAVVVKTPSAAPLASRSSSQSAYSAGERRAGLRGSPQPSRTHPERGTHNGLPAAEASVCSCCDHSSVNGGGAAERSTNMHRSTDSARRPPIPLAPQTPHRRLESPPLARVVDTAADAPYGVSGRSEEPWSSAGVLDDDTKEASLGDSRERSFERSEQRYSHLVTPPHASPEPATEEAKRHGTSRGAGEERSTARPTSGSDHAGIDRHASAEGAIPSEERIREEERGQERVQALERAHQRERVMEERVANLEDAVATLVAFMQRQQAQQEERMSALQAANVEQARRSEAAMAELKAAMAQLTERVAPQAKGSSMNGVASSSTADTVE